MPAAIARLRSPLLILHVHHSMTLEEARDFFKARRPCGPYMEVLYQHFGRPCKSVILKKRRKNRVSKEKPSFAQLYLALILCQ